MRLLDARTFQFCDFNPGDIPPYAILSHTWGTGEVTYDDVALNFGDETRAKPGWRKIRLTCQEALTDELEYVWVDTCCIDKRSSAELSEAINSMFAWYEQAVVCYVYLADIDYQEVGLESLRAARWFTRGWTLQELLAPLRLDFFSTDWVNVGTIRKGDQHATERGDISADVASITGIEIDVLRGQIPLESICVARRMSWASSRQTTRPEDISYCLLGIFNINMPTIYGEGTKAFQRLQEEIVKSSDDHSLFAWILPTAAPYEPYGLLAASPAHFAYSKDVSAFRNWTDTSPYSVGNLGLAITLPTAPRPQGEYFAELNCTWSPFERDRICMVLRRIPGTVNQYQRVRVSDRFALPRSSLSSTTRSQIHLRQKQILPTAADVIENRLFTISLPDLGPFGVSERRLSSFLYTDVAGTDPDWHDRLIRQEIFASETELMSTDLHLPGERATLSVVLCIETAKERNDPNQRAGKVPAQSQELRFEFKQLRELRKRANPSDRIRDKLLKTLKGSKAEADLEEPVAAEDSLLLLVGTAHDSHKPICLPLAGITYVERLEHALDIDGGPKPKHDAKARSPGYSKALCEQLFEELSRVFRSMARAHSRHPDINIRSGVDDVSLTFDDKSTSNSLTCCLEIKKPNRIELDSRQLPAELEGKAIEPVQVQVAREETEEKAKEEEVITPLSSTSPVVMKTPKLGPDTALWPSPPPNNGSWQRWMGETPTLVLHENVFELDEGQTDVVEEEIKEDVPTAPDSTLVDLTSIGTQLHG